MITITVDEIKRLRQTLDFDLLVFDEGKDSAFERLYSDTVLLVDVIYVLCQDQVAERRLTERDFARAMAGDTLSQATTAILNALTAFFPDPRRRALLRAILTKLDQVQEALLERAKGELDAFDIQHEIGKAFGAQSTDSPESPASIPDPTPSDS